MKILMINKFLYPNGGSETYVFKLGNYLTSIGHQVEYFGMDHENRCVGNRVNAYTTDMDFHTGSKLSKLIYPIKTIYSSEARKKIRLVLDDFQPDVCHLNNFNYQLTPSIILEIVRWRKQTGKKCRIIYTAHDGQLVCPNHMLRNPNTQTNCEKCLDGRFSHCIRGRCIHGSTAKSIIGAAEAYFWRAVGVYRHMDTVICCSDFMKNVLSHNPQLQGKLVTLHNFIDRPAIDRTSVVQGDYVLYFGRYSEEKGIETLIKACRLLPEIPFVFAGEGNYENELRELPNVTDVGFTSGEALAQLIREARFSVCPSICFDNCPFSVIESQAAGTPVIGADIGGIPELIQEGKTGTLFESGNPSNLAMAIKELWYNKERLNAYVENCKNMLQPTDHSYIEQLLPIYGGAYSIYALTVPDYVLYFGRYSEEKGIQTLLEVCRMLPQVKFVFAGKGPLENEINGLKNVENVGFQNGNSLNVLIQNALFSVYPSEWYENCPFSVIESLMLGTPVLGANIGGIPELIKEGMTGELFESGKRGSLMDKILSVWQDSEKTAIYSRNCRNVRFDTVEEYAEKLVRLYHETNEKLIN